MAVTQKVLYTSSILDVSTEEWCKRAGQDAAVLKGAGQSDEQVKEYVKKKLVRAGENRQEILECEAIARGQYVKSMKVINRISNPEYIVFFKGIGDEVCQVKRENLDKVTSCNWLAFELSKN